MTSRKDPRISASQLTSTHLITESNLRRSPVCPSPPHPQGLGFGHQSHFCAPSTATLEVPVQCSQMDDFSLVGVGVAASAGGSVEGSAGASTEKRAQGAGHPGFQGKSLRQAPYRQGPNGGRGAPGHPSIPPPRLLCAPSQCHIVSLESAGHALGRQSPASSSQREGAPASSQGPAALGSPPLPPHCTSGGWGVSEWQGPSTWVRGARTGAGPRPRPPLTVREQTTAGDGRPCTTSCFPS